MNLNFQHLSSLEIVPTLFEPAHFDKRLYFCIELHGYFCFMPELLKNLKILKSSYHTFGDQKRKQ